MLCKLEKVVRPLNEASKEVFSGAMVKGHLCFEVSRNDASTLVLYVNAPGCNASITGDTCNKQVWFALR